MIKVIEILFRRKWGLLALLLLPILVGLAIAYKLPRQYQASAGLWALRRYEIIGATGPESDLLSTPAQTQATSLGELLQTRSFALAVADDTDLPRILSASNPDVESLQNALFMEISTKVVTTPVGYNLFNLTYINDNPAVALQVVKAVVRHYGMQSGTESVAEGTQLLATYTIRLQEAQHQADQETKAVAQYVQDHQLTPVQAQIDAEYQLLTAKVAEDNAVVGTIQGDINTVRQQLAVLNGGATGLYSVIDNPNVPSRPISRIKVMLLSGGIGLAVGLLAAAGFFLFLLRMDQLLYSLADVRLSTSYPVLVQLPRLPSPRIAEDPPSKRKLFASKVLPKWGG